MVCIYADNDVIESLLSGDVPGSSYFKDILEPRAFVKLIYGEWKEQATLLGPEDEEDEEVRAMYNAGDEGFEPINGCMREDVGWVNAAARALSLAIYSDLRSGGWWKAYVRPPEIKGE